MVYTVNEISIYFLWRKTEYIQKQSLILTEIIHIIAM